MEINTFVVGAWQTNCYLVTSGAESILIDPGAQPQRLQEVTQGKNVVALVLTHAHSDHIGAVNELRAHYQCPVFLHGADLLMAQTPAYSGFADEGSDYKVENVERVLKEGDLIQFGETQLQVFHTPGHTPGSAVFVSERNKIMFAGDTLFNFGIGATHYPLGDYGLLCESLARIGTWDHQLKVLPGHGPRTVLGAEYRRIPQLRGRR